MTRALAVLFIATLAVAAIGIGCGGGDDSDAGTSSNAAGAASEVGDDDSRGVGNEDAPDDTGADGSPGKSAFIAQANALCARSRAKLGRVVEARATAYAKEHPEDPAGDKVFAAVLTGAVLPAIQDQVDEIRRLRAPEGEEGKVQAILTALQADIDELSANPPSDSDKFVATTARSSALARDYGIPACAFATEE